MLLHHALIDLQQARRGSGSSTGSKDPSPRASLNKLNPWAGMDDKRKEVLDRKNRYELLTSRLVRLHWDPSHMARVKAEYKDKYQVPPEHDVEDFLKEGPFQEFCLRLLEGRR
jgi:hypothetical protein